MSIYVKLANYSSLMHRYNPIHITCSFRHSDIQLALGSCPWQFYHPVPNPTACS